MAKKTWRAWTQKEIARVEAMRLEGMPLVEIAAGLNRTRSSIKGLVAQEEICLAHPGRERWAKLLVNPIPLKEAARMMGVTVGAVKKRKTKLKKLGFKIAALTRR
jgi:transposase